MERYRVVVLAGGPSLEREISLKSGEAVVAALSKSGHEVSLLDPSETAVESVSWSKWDVAFIALHGTFGEDGQIQKVLEQAGLPFTGSGSVSSKHAFDKRAAKQIFRTNYISTPEYLAVSRKVHHDHTVFSLDDRHSEIFSVVERLGMPVVVKPNAQGSSLGVTWVDSIDNLLGAIEQSLQFDDLVLVERAIQGTEWTVAFMDHKPLPAIQVKPADGFFDYRSKYDDDQTLYLFDHDLPLAVQYNLYETAQRACRALGTRGISRVDLRLDLADEPWVLEVNTVPGMTDHSLVPKAAARLGMSFEELCDLAIRRALLHPSEAMADDHHEDWKTELLGEVLS